MIIVNDFCLHSTVDLSNTAGAMTRKTEKPLDSIRIDPDEQMIVDRIYAAVMERRLAPRTKLSEAVLCKSFGVGRMRVRRALLLLGSQGIVDLRSNRGAYVACPDADEAREVFEARLMIETAIVRELSAGLSEPAVAALHDQVRLEDDARRSGDRTQLIRLSGEFHVELARRHGNTVLTRTIRELVTRTSLIVALFGVSRHSACPDNEHGGIISAIIAGDGERAALATRLHLQHIQAGLDLDRTETNVFDLASILGGE